MANNTQSLHAALERLRAAARESLDFKEQLKFFNLIDAVQQAVAKGEVQMESLTGTLVRAKTTVRKSLKSEPIGMNKMLNGLEALEEELMRVVDGSE